jgi:Fe-S cluster biogenesis protein NfuA
VLQRFEACRAALGIVLVQVDGDCKSVTAAPMTAESVMSAEFNLNVSGV